MNKSKEHDINLIIVASIEEYSLLHHIPVKDVISLLKKHNIIPLLRSEYEVLHMMDLNEGRKFAESILETALL